MTEPVDNPPIRLIGRHMRQILFDTVLDWKRVFSGNLNLGGVALAQSQAAARALDAADGVIDGQHFGSVSGAP